MYAAVEHDFSFHYIQFLGLLLKVIFTSFVFIDALKSIFPKDNFIYIIDKKYTYFNLHKKKLTSLRQNVIKPELTTQSTNFKILISAITIECYYKPPDQTQTL